MPAAQFSIGQRRVRRIHLPSFDVRIIVIFHCNQIAQNSLPLCVACLETHREAVPLLCSGTLRFQVQIEYQWEWNAGQKKVYTLCMLSWYCCCIVGFNCQRGYTRINEHNIILSCPQVAKQVECKLWPQKVMPKESQCYAGG